MTSQTRGALLAVGLSLLVFGLLAAAAGFLGGEEAPDEVTLEDLEGVEDLRSRFNADRGVTRLIMVLSPT